MAVRELKIRKFDGGQADDVRDASPSESEFSAHFDIFEHTTRLTPYRDQETDLTITSTSTSVTTFTVKNFLYANSTFYGYGRVSDALAAPRLIEKTGSIQSGNWALSATGTAPTGSANYKMFKHYKNYIYGYRSGSTIWRYGDITTGAKAWDNGWNSVAAFSNHAQAHIAKDDVLYLPHDNFLSGWDNTTFATALTLPSNQAITALDDWQNYLAIGTKPTDSGDTSKTYLWDLVSDDISDVIDWGEGDLLVQANIDGALIGVMNVNTAQNVSILPKMIIKRWAGGTVETLKEINLVDSSGERYEVTQMQRKRGNKLYFAVIGGLSQTGTELSGIWVVGRKNRNRPFAVTKDRKLNGDTGMINVHNFFFVGDYMWASWDTATGNDVVVEKTDDIATYTYNSDYVTGKFGLPEFCNELMEVKVMTKPLSSGEQVVVQYRTDEDTAWTTIMTHDVDNSTRKIATRNQADKINFKEFSEAQIRARSTGGAVITGIYAKWREKEIE